MTTRSTVGKRLGKVEGWGIVFVGTGKELNLVYSTGSRMDVREMKREVYPGQDYQVVRINSTLYKYNK